MELGVGSVVSSFVSSFEGEKEPDDESKNGEFFHAFLARTGTAPPINVLRRRRHLAGLRGL